MKQVWLLAVVVGLALVLWAAQDVRAAETAAAPEQSAGGVWDKVQFAVFAIGVALIMMAGAFATAMVQKAIGPAVVGAVAEDRKFLGPGLILLALPETIIVFCVGVAYMLFTKIH